jgi:PAS domain S-box-containing protein
MSPPLQILHLEDNPTDAELVAGTLAAEGLSCAFVRAATRVDFIAALERDVSYDVILSDYALPGFDGVSARALAVARRPEVPFLFVSGTMGEEVAIDCLKDGATDYVLKHRLARLAPAVRRALEERRNRREREAVEAENRRLNAALEVALGQANTFLDSIFENLPDLVFVKDAGDLRFVRVNRASEGVIGLDSAALIGKRARDVYPQAVADALEANDRRAVSGRAVVDVPEEVFPTRERGARIFHTKRIPILNRQGEPEYVLCIAVDITERRVAEEDVRLARLEAERANRAKSEFLSRMSHDLRTPLNAVLGYAQVLDADELGPEHRDSVHQILAGGRHLLELINEVLDIARIEAGRLSLWPEPIAVPDLLRHAADLMRPLASAREIDVTIDASAAGMRHVQADRQRLTQVLLNFLGNAVKYNRPGGRVTIAVRPIDAGRIRIGVTDTGAGIPPDKLALLFQPFERLDAQQSAVEGTGLGLAVSKGLAEAMGGTVGVDSEVGRGTTFWVELSEIEGLEAAAPPTLTADVAPGSRHEPAGVILYIEDNHSNVRLLQRLLGRRSAVRLLTASSGEAGIEMALREHPDLILLDMHLPDLSGEEVLQRLWADPRTRSHPVAVLSADATHSQRQRMLAAGVVDYLTKPLDIGQLLRLVDDRLGSSSRPGTTS